MQTTLFLWRCCVVEYGFSLQTTNYFHVFSGPWDLFGSHIRQKQNKAKITVASAQHKTLFESFLTTRLGMNAAPPFQNFKTDHYTTPNCLKFSSWDNFVEIIEAFHYHWSNIEFNFLKLGKIYLQASKLADFHLKTSASVWSSPETLNFIPFSYDSC